jgi:hypothetical protein
MDHDQVMRWVQAYEQAWRGQDVGAVRTLFTEQAQYRSSPYDPPMVGHQAIEEFWPDDGETFTMTAEPVAVEDATAVVRVLIRYGDPVNQEYTDLWVLQFANDGRVADFEEWAYWPGRRYTPEGDG